MFSTELPSADQGSHAVYDPKKSSHWKQMKGYTFDINYVGGVGASGIVGTDVVNIGGAIVPNQAIELANTIRSGRVNGDGDGMLGLAFKEGNSGRSQQAHVNVEC